MQSPPDSIDPVHKAAALDSQGIREAAVLETAGVREADILKSAGVRQAEALDKQVLCSCLGLRISLQGSTSDAPITLAQVE